MNGSSKRPKLGYIITLLGGIVIFLAAIEYLACGNATVGVVGIILVILTVLFGRRAYLTTKKKD